MKSGMLAAEACIEHIAQSNEKQALTNYPQKITRSWIRDELYPVRNIRPGFQRGLFWGMINAGFETYITRGKSPWTSTHHADHTTLTPANKAKKIDYPAPDNTLTFDRLSSVYLTNTAHEENQPCHLKLTHEQDAITVNYEQYASPETRYCPAQVYEIIEENEKTELKINAQNCIQCKTCDIKDPTQNITWVAPEGGSGPNYTDM